VDVQTILSLLSLAISALLAYVYLQIRLNLSETIVRILNGRYLRTDVSELKFRRIEEMLTELRNHLDVEMDGLERRLNDLHDHIHYPNRSPSSPEHQPKRQQTQHD